MVLRWVPESTRIDLRIDPPDPPPDWSRDDPPDPHMTLPDPPSHMAVWKRPLFMVLLTIADIKRSRPGIGYARLLVARNEGMVVNSVDS